MSVIEAQLQALEARIKALEALLIPQESTLAPGESGVLPPQTVDQRIDWLQAWTNETVGGHEQRLQKLEKEKLMSGPTRTIRIDIRVTDNMGGHTFAGATYTLTKEGAGYSELLQMLGTEEKPGPLGLELRNAVEHTKAQIRAAVDIPLPAMLDRGVELYRK